METLKGKEKQTLPEKRLLRKDKTEKRPIRAGRKRKTERAGSLEGQIKSINRSLLDRQRTE